jgi:hypothetical protein
MLFVLGFLYQYMNWDFDPNTFSESRLLFFFIRHNQQEPESPEVLPPPVIAVPMRITHTTLPTPPPFVAIPIILPVPIMFCIGGQRISETDIYHYSGKEYM